MEIITCKKCGTICQYVSGPRICANCKKLEEDIFREVKEFLRENKGATLEQVSSGTGASVKLITRFLREGRLQVSEQSPMKIGCERCGTPIAGGRYCKACSEAIQGDLQKHKKVAFVAEKEETKTSGNRMHFLNKK